MSYEFFDKIYCINLKSRKDRYNLATQTFNKLNIHNVEFYITDKSPQGGEYGCFESHINVIKKAYYAGYNNILIFEDDVKDSNYYDSKLLEIAINFMKYNKQWDIFYLGYAAYNSYRETIIFSKKINNHIINFNPLHAQAYCLNKNSMLKILTNYKKYINNTPIDRFYNNKKYFNNYCIIPLLFIQHACLESDIDLDRKIKSGRLECFLNKINFYSNITYIYSNSHKIIFLFILIIIFYFYYNKIN